MKVLEMFKTSSSIHLAVVVNEYGEVEGIVTDSDIFEAIVGSLPANYDTKDFAFVKKQDGNSWLVDGMTPIDEIIILIGIEEINFEEKYDTIAGFMLDNLPSAPNVGDKISKYGYSFEIIHIEGSRINQILISQTE